MNSWRDTVDHHTETFMDRMTECDSVGEFAEVELPFRQYPLSQTDFLCQQTHLLLNVCQLTRILSFLSICVCVCVCACACQCLFVCECKPWSSSVPVLMGVGLAGGHHCMTIGALVADLIKVNQSHSSCLEETASYTHTHTHSLHPVPVHSPHLHQYILTSRAALPGFSE